LKEDFENEKIPIRTVQLCYCPFFALSCGEPNHFNHRLNYSGSTADTVGAVKADAAPKIDGTVDSVWSKAKPISIIVSGGANLPGGSTTVELRALYTADTVYFLAQYADPRKV